MSRCGALLRSLETMATTTFGFSWDRVGLGFLQPKQQLPDWVGTSGLQSFSYTTHFTPVFICSHCLTQSRFLIVYDRYFHIVIL